MSLRDWVVAFISGGALSAVTTLLGVWLQNRHASGVLWKQQAAEWQRLQQQQAAEWQRLQQQLEAERQRLLEQWEREQQDRLRLEAVAILEERLNRVVTYCEAVTSLLAAIVEDDKPRVERLAFDLPTLLMDAFVGAHQLRGQPLIKLVHLIDDKVEEIVGISGEQKEIGKAAEQAHLGLVPLLAYAKDETDRVRWDIRKNPVARLEAPASTSDDVKQREAHCEPTQEEDE